MVVLNGNLHLVDGDTVGSKSNGLPYTLLPVLRRLADHAGNKIDIDLRKSDGPREVVGAIDLLGAVRPPIDLENMVVKILNTQAQSSDANFSNHFQLVLGERARLAFEGDFLRRVPRQQFFHPASQP